MFEALSSVYTANLVVEATYTASRSVPPFVDFQTLQRAGFELAHAASSGKFSQRNLFESYAHSLRSLSATQQHQLHNNLDLEAQALLNVTAPENLRRFSNATQLFQAIADGNAKLVSYDNLYSVVSAMKTFDLNICAKLLLVKLRTNTRALPSLFAVAKHRQALVHRINSATKWLYWSGLWQLMSDKHMQNSFHDNHNGSETKCLLSIYNAATGHSLFYGERGMFDSDAPMQQQQRRKRFPKAPTYDGVTNDDKRFTPANDNNMLHIDSFVEFLLLFCLASCLGIVCLLVENFVLCE